MAIPSEFAIGKNIYRSIRKREQQDVYVYGGDNTYLRIGNVRVIQSETGKHNALRYFTFPVPKILESGWIFEHAYYIEETFGLEQLSRYFVRDFKARGRISAKNFGILLAVVQRFANAQLQSIAQKSNWHAFLSSIHLPLLKNEAPQFRTRLDKAFEKIQQRLAKQPFVLSHGDFNVHNIFPRGVIDMEHVMYAPAGYDIVTLIAHTDMFPLRGQYEFRRWYEFSPSQKEEYFALADRVYKNAGIRTPSMYLDELTLCRAVWSSARMQKYPRLQKWRFAILGRLLDDFLKK